MAAGWKSSRSTPLLGLAFLISATTADFPASSRLRNAPSKSRAAGAARAFASTSANGATAFADASSSAFVARIRCRMSLIGSGLRRELVGQRDERVELAPRGAAGNRFARALDALLDRGGLVGGVERGSRVQDHDVARRSLDIVERLQQHRPRALRVVDLQPAVAHHPHSEVFRMDLVLANLAIDELADHRRGAERYLVHAVASVDDYDVLAAQPLQHADLNADEIGVEDTEQLVCRPRGVRQWTEDIED